MMSERDKEKVRTLKEYRNTLRVQRDALDNQMETVSGLIFELCCGDLNEEEEK